MSEINTAVLVIDDDEMVRDNIAEILVPDRFDPSLQAIQDAVNVLFDAAKPILVARTPHIPVFTVDKASNGMEGLRLVISAIEQGHPYAVIFIDMRMPGWSGLETALEIRKHDEKAEIIFVTAYSDSSIDEIVEQAGQNVGYHCKPYAPEEIIQLATKAVTDYNKLRNLEKLIESISTIGLNKNQLTSLLKNILEQLAGSLNTDLALIGKLHADYRYEKFLSIGALEERVDIDQLIERVRNVPIAPNEVLQIGELVIARLENYSVFALLNGQERLKTEKMYLLRLFVQNAAQAIRNAELQEKLLQTEKLSAVGQVIGMVMHDLRTPVKNIHLITEMIREEGCTPELLEMIEKSAEQASEIFNDFLDYIKKTSIRKCEVSLYTVINEALTSVRNRDEAAGIDILTEIPVGIKLLGDAGKLRRSFGNIFNNSIDALYMTTISEKRIIVSAFQKQGSVQISIADNGPGFPQEIADTIFDPFVTKNKSGGTGLGLAIVKQYIEAHGGSVAVANDNGAALTIELPIII
ncbi:MAG: ATP-binding protein [Bacteroidota bacterium]|nr:ATP-binding protein [Bacteroidota bacterium]